ncbi:mesenteric estrogen-dependent adipogenesis protein [Gastrophryne carolinensis]
MAVVDDVSRSHVERMSSTRSYMSISSVSSDVLATTTTANCEIAVIPLELLVDLQANFLSLENNVFTSNNQVGGFNVFSDGQALINGQQCQVLNYIQRKVTLKSHADYTDYRKTILGKPILFITNAQKVNSPSGSGKTFAFIVNTRHPQMKARVEGAMDQIISSVMGENYTLEFNFSNALKEYLGRQSFELTENNLSFSFTFKLDVFLDLFFLLGFSKKSCAVEGKILNLYCTNNEKKEKVKIFLSKMTNPLIRAGSSFDRDRKPSIFSLDVIMEDPFPAEEAIGDKEPVLPINS